MNPNSRTATLICLVKDFFRYYGFWAQFWLLCGLNLADYLLTRPAVLLFGAKAEGNPFLSHAVRIYGVTSIFWVKLVFLTILALLLLIYGQGGAAASDKARRVRIAKIIGAANIWYVLVVGYGCYLWSFYL